MIIHAARQYVSPRTRPLTWAEQETRRLSYALKDWTRADFPAAVAIAAAEMANLIEGPCYLVPVPSSKCTVEANALLCDAIAGLMAGARVRRTILRRIAPVESSCNRHKRGAGAVPVAEHGFIREETRWLDAIPLYFVDNTTTSGNTLAAARAAFGFGDALVFSDAGLPLFTYR